MWITRRRGGLPGAEAPAPPAICPAACPAFENAMTIFIRVKAGFRYFGKHDRHYVKRSPV